MPGVPAKFVVGLDAFSNCPPVPLVILQLPVPTVGVLAARTTKDCPQVAAPVWSGPALAVVGAALFVSTTSSVDAVQGLFEIVHLNVALLPEGTPVTPEL